MGKAHTKTMGGLATIANDLNKLHENQVDDVCKDL